jgi:hypothetical protein
MTFQHSGSYSNNWEALDMSAEFISPDDDTFRIGGFYFNTGQWKFRFTPVVEGTWNYNVRIAHNSDEFTESGQFTCTAGTRPGFIKVCPENPYRFVYEDGSPFYPYGLQSCVGNQLPMSWNLDMSQRVTGEQYIQAFANNGMTVWRASLGNCAPRIYDAGDIQPTGNNFDVQACRIYDSLLYYAHKHGMRIVLNPCFDCDVWVDEWADSSKMEDVKRMVRFIIDRWGAYADIIEIANEPYGFDPFPLPGFDHLPLEWLNIILPTIKERDPYNHLIAQDLLKRHLAQQEYVDKFDLIMPHWYHDGKNLEQDTIISNRIQILKDSLEVRNKPMPILYGEQGYQQATRYHSDSPRWQRMRYWTAIFNESGIISWHQN